jgi:serine/threonine-protein kinase CTR1
MSEELQLTVKKSWRPPELVDFGANSQASAKQDIWNLGEFLYFLLFASKPFSDRRSQMAGSYVLPREVSGKARDLLRMTIDPVAERRGDITEVMTKILEQQPVNSSKILCCLPARNAQNGRTTIFHPKKSTAKCIIKLITATQDPPRDKYIRKLVDKAWAKPSKIPKFYKELLSFRSLDLPQIRIKILLSLHEYIRLAPLLSIQTTPGALTVISQVEANCPVSANDVLRSEYFRGLVMCYCQALRAKVTIHNSYLRLFDGQFRMKEEIGSGDMEASGPLTLPLVQDLMSCLKRMLRAMEAALAPGALLQALRETMIKVLGNEVTSLIQPLMALLTSWKRLNGQDNGVLISDFQATYSQAQSLFQRSKDSRLSDPPPEFLTINSVSSYSLLDSSPLDSVVSQQGVNPAVVESLVSEFHTARSSGSQVGSRTSFDLIDLSQEGLASYAQRINQSLQNWQIALDEVTLIRLIGTGASSEVWLGSYRKTAVAVKKIRMERVENGVFREFGREVAALVQLRHPNLVLFMGAYLGTPLSVITEYCSGGDLYHLLHSDKGVFLSWEQKLKMCLDIAKGMHFLHSCSPAIIHRDLKSLNLLVETPIHRPGDPVHIKVSDFGLAKAFREREMMTGQLGTCVSDMQHWMAPEVLQSQSYTLKADVYSYAVCAI